MSDDEEEYEYEYDDDASDMDADENDDEDEDDEEESFDYTDEEEEPDDVDVALENAYYNAKQCRDSGEMEEAIDGFEEVVRMETEALSGDNDEDGSEDEEMEEDGGGKKKTYGPWSYKAIKQLVKLHLKNGDGIKMMEQYERMLGVVGFVSPNAVEKGVNGMLERVSSLYQVNGGGGGTAAAATSGAGGNTDPQVWARNVYDATLRVFHPKTGSSPNERLWFKTNLKYGQLLYEMNETAKLQLVIKDLLRSSGEKQGGADGAGGGSAEGESAGGSNSNNSSGASTHLMEISALQIQLYSRQKDTKKLREVFQRAMRVQGGIPHPRTLALIQELGGKMHMTNREFDSASKTFFQAFKSYDEAGDPARLRCLKYLVMASMLHASKINPFDSQEARPYKDDPEIVAMTNLVAAFHNNEIKDFEGILQRNEGKIMDDEFVREHVSDLLRTIRTQVLRKVIGPYTRISVSAIARELNYIPVSDVESLLVSLILDGKLDGRIDQVGGVLYKRAEKGGSSGAAGDDNNDGGGGTTGGGGSSGQGGGTSSTTASRGGSGVSTTTSSGGTSVAISGKDGSGGKGAVEVGFGEDADGAWGYSGSVEARNCAAIESLTVALENLTASVTSAGGRSTYHQIM